MSNEKWQFRSKALLEDVFADIQVVGITEHFTFRGGTSGDSLIYAYVGSPHDNVLAILPPLDELSPSVNDISSHRFGSGNEILTEIERILSRCDAPLQRNRKKKHSFFAPSIDGTLKASIAALQAMHKISER